jgi:hypothetical protein
MKNLFLSLLLTAFSSLAMSCPLTLTSFTGQFASNQSVDLSWSTMVEINTAYFEVQRSSDGVHFEDIMQIASLGSDTSTVYEHVYNYADNAPLPGTSYYRLLIVDRDGTNSHSGVVEVSAQAITGIKIYPTVVQNNNLFVQSDKSLPNARLEIFDLSGRKIGETDWETLSGHQMAICSTNAHLSGGTYLARLSSNGQKVLNQLIILP